DCNVGEILEVMESSLAPVACLKESSNSCPLAPECKTLPMWKESYELMRDFFFSKKLSDLL
ncbi:MAG: Rrf2 family transcriptional regulator, partial [Lachnospiraceae bacterium]|nr:Rrf2 family transcriptional regulator [Lachnospiraceae bacterium]